MDSAKRTRAYASPLREQAARRTRELILAAALELCVGQGYVATTIEQIADRAGCRGQPWATTKREGS